MVFMIRKFGLQLLSVFHDAIGLLDFASDGFEHIMRNNLLGNS